MRHATNAHAQAEGPFEADRPAEATGGVEWRRYVLPKGLRDKCAVPAGKTSCHLSAARVRSG